MWKWSLVLTGVVIGLVIWWAFQRDFGRLEKPAPGLAIADNENRKSQEVSWLSWDAIEEGLQLKTGTYTAEEIAPGVLQIRVDGIDQTDGKSSGPGTYIFRKSSLEMPWPSGDYNPAWPPQEPSLLTPREGFPPIPPMKR